MGDVLCCTPAIRALRRAFPRAYIAALVVRYSQDAILGNPDLDEVFVYEKAKHRPDRSRLASLYRQWRVEWKLKRMRFDLAIGMRSTFAWSEAWIVYLTGARYRLGYCPGKKDERFSFFYNLQAFPPEVQCHEVEKVLHLVSRIGVPAGETHLLAAIPGEEKRKADAFLAERKIDPRRLVGFHLSSRVPANRWPPASFAALAGRLIREKGQSVVLTWGPGDQDLAREVEGGAGAKLFLYPTPNFKSLGAIQERCRAVVSSDGGPMHFATAVGTPTIGLFGKTDPRQWGPWGGHHLALRRGAKADMITVEEVYQALTDMIGSQL